MILNNNNDNDDGQASLSDKINGGGGQQLTLEMLKKMEQDFTSSQKVI